MYNLQELEQGPGKIQQGPLTNNRSWNMAHVVSAIVSAWPMYA